jgi:hypothetical protein
MGQRLIITENERNHINKMYGLVNESLVGKGLELFIVGETRPGQEEPAYRVMIVGPAKWVSNHHISIPVTTADKSREGNIITKCDDDYGYYYFMDGAAASVKNPQNVFLTREGENILKPEIKRLCAQFVSNDGEDMSNMA